MRRGLIGWRKTLVLRRLQTQCFLDPSGYITPVIYIYIYIWIKPKFSNTHARFNPMFQVAYDPQKIRNENYLETTVNRLFALRFSPISPFKFNKKKKNSPFKVLKVGSSLMRWLFFLSSSSSLSAKIRFGKRKKKKKKTWGEIRIFRAVPQDSLSGLLLRLR